MHFLFCCKIFSFFIPSTKCSNEDCLAFSRIKSFWRCCWCYCLDFSMLYWMTFRMTAELTFPMKLHNVPDHVPNDVPMPFPLTFPLMFQQTSFITFSTMFPLTLPQIRGSYCSLQGVPSDRPPIVPITDSSVPNWFPTVIRIKETISYNPC
jgi:hypothetical protein